MSRNLAAVGDMERTWDKYDLPTPVPRLPVIMSNVTTSHRSIAEGCLLPSGITSACDNYQLRFSWKKTGWECLKSIKELNMLHCHKQEGKNLGRQTTVSKI